LIMKSVLIRHWYGAIWHLSPCWRVAFDPFAAPVVERKIGWWPVDTYEARFELLIADISFVAVQND
jgi:hypothetical protein